MSRSVAAPQISAAAQTIASKVDCAPQLWARDGFDGPNSPELDYRHQRCTYEDDSHVEITVMHFDETDNGTGTHWGVQIDEFVTWVIEVQKKLDRFKFAYDKRILIYFADFDFFGEKPGYALCTPVGGAKTLYIVPKHNRTQLLAQQTVAHEYFHHAQCHEGNKIEGMDLVLREWRGYEWLTEGSADWFARHVFPGTSMIGKTVNQKILEVGLNADEKNDDLRTYPYHRDAFFGLLWKRCGEKVFPSLLKNILNIEEDAFASLLGGFYGDNSAARRLSAVLLQSNCDFSSLGSDLGAALADYQFTSFYDDPDGVFHYYVDRENPDTEVDPDHERAELRFEYSFVRGVRQPSFEKTYCKGDCITGNIRGETALNADRPMDSFSIDLPAVAAKTIRLYVSSSRGKYAEQDGVEVSLESPLPVHLSVEECSRNDNPQECTEEKHLERDTMEEVLPLAVPSNVNEESGLLITLVNPDLERDARITFRTRLVSSEDDLPPAPTNLRVSADASSVTLRWDRVAGAGIRYVVYQQYGGGRHWAREVAGTSTTFSGLQANTEYCWDVVAVNPARQESAPSATQCARTERGETMGEASLFWLAGAGGLVQRSNLDGSGVETLVDFGRSVVHDMAVDLVERKAYIADANSGAVHRANLDGTSVETIISGLSRPEGIALDGAGKMYVTARGIFRANLDGSDVETIVPSLPGPQDIALDVANSMIYWVDPQSDKIHRARMDGSRVEDLVTSGLSQPEGLTLDLQGRKMYWADALTRKIQRANLDGSGVEDIVTGLRRPYSVAFDSINRMIYWTDEGVGRIQRANPDGSSVETVVDRAGRGGRGPFGLVLEVTVQPRRQTFSDTLTSGGQGPEMVVIPAGTFRMGCLNDDGDCGSHGFPQEKPVHQVSIRSFALSKYEVTFDQWEECVSAGGCTHHPGDQGWGRGNRPVININWHDAQEYVAWLSAQTGEDYRLPSEAEWEYAARAGTETKYSWGNDLPSNLANCRSDCGDPFGHTASVGSFPANPWGLHDMHGNVWEWTEDCLHSDYNGAPTDGRAWTSRSCLRRAQDGVSLERVLRGGAYDYPAYGIRSAIRGSQGENDRRYLQNDGFRVARSLP